MEVRIFNLDLSGVVSQTLRKLENDINTFLATRELVSIEQSVLPASENIKPRLLVTIVAKRKSEN
ncbi:MAG: hypothetical protein IJT73_04825 [Selenomonadaceae bacterium]|nr:hypothetical protein [Selenomonadaceae bacterium]